MLRLVAGTQQAGLMEINETLIVLFCFEIRAWLSMDKCYLWISALIIFTCGYGFEAQSTFLLRDLKANHTALMKPVLTGADSKNTGIIFHHYDNPVTTQRVCGGNGCGIFVV